MYVEMHARSAFSFLEGASVPEELAGVCAEYGMPAMALLDRDGVYGSPRFHLAAEEGIHRRAHWGGSNVRGRMALSAAGGIARRIPESVPADHADEIARAKRRRKCFTLEIAEKAEGLICLTGGEEGPLAYALAHEGIEGATECVRNLCEIFGRRNVYVELQRHFCRDEEARNQAAVEIARKLGLPLLATNGVCHAQPREREALDVFTCIRHHRTLETAGRLLSRNSERHLKSPGADGAHYSPICPKRSPIRESYHRGWNSS